jgi:hypothetical protein
MTCFRQVIIYLIKVICLIIGEYNIRIVVFSGGQFVKKDKYIKCTVNPNIGYEIILPIFRLKLES